MIKFEHDRKTAILELHYRCDLNCRYCANESSSNRGFGSISEKTKREKLLQFFNAGTLWNVVLSGGEPLITPKIETIVHTLIKNGHALAFQTNLMHVTPEFFCSIKGDKISWILASLHYPYNKTWPTYKMNIIYLKQRGFNVIPRMLFIPACPIDEYIFYFDQLVMLNFNVLASALYTKYCGYISEVADYSDKQRKELIYLMIADESKNMLNGGFESKGIFCKAGFQRFNIDADSGLIYACCQSRNETHGNLYDDTFKPLDSYSVCPYDRCYCDINNMLKCPQA